MERVWVYDLLDSALFLTLSQAPERLEQELTSEDQMVVIDEIKRLPELLNEVHPLIGKKEIHFY